MYAFLFDKKSLALLILGAAVLGGLLFFAGFLVGIENGFPSAATRVAAAPAAPPSPSPSPAPQPASAPPTVPAGAGDDAMATEAPLTGEAAEPAAAPGAGLGDGLPAWEDLPLADEPAPAEAAPAPAPALAEPAVPAAPLAAGYALQVGAFRDKDNCDSVVEDLAGRGYDPYVVEIRTPRRRVLRAVRLGRYPDRGEAARAAAELARKEGMEAVVLPASF